MVQRIRLAARGSRATFVVRPLFAALVASGVVAPAQGATINVTTAGDTSSGTSCTARDAVTSLNNAALQNGCAIASGAFGSGDTVDLSLQTGTIALTNGALMPTVTMAFQGPGATALTISGSGASRVIEAPAGDVSIDGLTIANGRSVGPGGCVFASDLSLANSVVSGCVATSDPQLPYFNGLGGGVAAKYVNSYRSTIVGNVAATAGGGVFAYAGAFTQTLVTGNTVNRTVCPTPEDNACLPAFLGGGGILGATVFTLGSTISGNTVNASRFTKYDDATKTFYNTNIGIGGGISQWPLDFYTAPGLSAKAGIPRIGPALFGANARNRGGAARASVKAKVAAARGSTPTNKADGFVDSGLGLAFSTVSGNRVTGDRQAQAKYAGGGAMAISIYYNAEVANSTISGNRLDASPNVYTIGGAILTTAADLTSSTITGNAGSIAVAMQLSSPGLAPPAAKRGGAFAKAWPKWQGKFAASTGNSAKAATGRNKALAPPVFDSTIIANNASAQYDFACSGGCTIGGSNNLIRTWDPTATLPGDTLTSDPQLAPLADNGGTLTGAPNHSLTRPMPTHLLFVGSPAIDTGSNPEDFPFDQRGPGFPRVVGAGPDIGAIEGVTRRDVPVPALAPWLVALMSALLGALGLRLRRRR
jgi:hypothetical protein